MKRERNNKMESKLTLTDEEKEYLANDVLAVKEAINVLNDYRQKILSVLGDDNEPQKIVNSCIHLIENLSLKQKEPCSVCAGLENRDTLYVYSDSNVGNGFDYIKNVKYCPVCGRRLNNE